MIKQSPKSPFPYGYLLLGLLVGMIGASFLVFREAFSILAIATGIIIIVFSLVLFSQALLEKRRGFLFICKLIVAISGIICGIITLIIQSDVIYVISNVIYLLLIMDGAYKLGAAFHSHKYYLARFWIISSLGVILLVSAFLMTKYEISADDSANILHSVLTGILLVGDGVMNTLYAFCRNSFHEKKDTTNQPIVTQDDITGTGDNDTTQNNEPTPPVTKTPFDDDPFTI